jgi:flagellar biosynthesis/type III secretory pathway chaperone
METNEMIGQLLDILSQETEMYQAMSTVLNKEKDAAIQSEIIALNEAEIEKENILVALGLLERQRRNLVADLADTLGYSAQDINLTQIVQIVDEPLAGRLRRTKSDLSALLESVQAANQRNKQIFEHSQALLRGSFNLLSELRAPSPIYYRTGTMQNTSASGKCVCDEI